MREALPKCNLSKELEAELKDSFDSCLPTLHKIRRKRNSILHSAFIQLKAGGEVVRIMRSNPRLERDKDSDEYLWDQEYLTEDSFETEMRQMGEVWFFLNRVYCQPVQRYTNQV